MKTRLLFTNLYLLIFTVLPGQVDQKSGLLKEFNHKQEQQIFFTENKGQVSDQYHQPRPDVLFSGEAGGMVYHLRKDGISYQLYRVESWREAGEREKQPGREREQIPDTTTVYRTDINWLGINPDYKVVKGQVRLGYENYYLAVCPEGVSGVRSFERVTYKDIYPGIDLQWYDNHGRLEYDFVVAPGIDYRQIRWEIKGAEALSISESGELVIQTPLGEIREQAPVAYQGEKGVAAEWDLKDQTIGFKVSAYDPALPLIIDPIVLLRQWGTYYGGAEIDRAYTSVLDDSLNIYMVGSTPSMTSIATTGAYQSTYGGGFSDGFLVKFNNDGIRQWATYYGGTGDDAMLGCTIDNDNSSGIYVTGGTSSNSGIATVGSHQSNFGGTQDAFLVKFNLQGGRQWATYYGGTRSESSRSCVLDGSSNIYITGSTFSTSGIATAGSHQSSLSGSGLDSDAFLVKFDSGGVRQWGTYYGGSKDDVGIVCVLGDSSEVYLAGYAASISSIASPGSHQPNYGGGNIDAFIAKFSDDGVRQWATYYGGTNSDFLGDCAVDSSSNIFCTGMTFSANAIASSGSHQVSLNGQNDAYLVKFNRNGVRQWATYYGGSYLEGGDACVVDDSLNIYLIGESWSDTSIATPGAYQISRAGRGDVMLVKFDSNGIRQWGSYYGGAEIDNPNDCLLDNSYDIYITGETNSVSGIASTGSHQASYGGDSRDGFLVKFIQCYTTASTLTDSACSHYTSPSGLYTWTTSGIYTDTILNARGCDSIISIDLKIKNTFDTINASVCDSLISPSGNYTWATNGIYTDTLPNASGCDSVITVNLTVNNSSVTINPVVCDSLISPSGNYVWTATGTYLDTLLNTAGCDSIITVNLTVNSNNSAVVNTIVCDSLVSPSGRYTWFTSGSYIDTVPNTAGCDSIIMINLTVKSTSSVTINPVVCDSLISPSGNYVWTATGIYLDTLLNAAGCDSIITVNLTVNNNSSSINRIVCDSLVSPSGRYTWFTSGSYMDTVPNTAGCDSVITINLTIDNSSATFNPVVCDSLVSPSGKYVWQLTGIYTDTIPNVVGCDSIMTFNLTVNSTTLSTINRRVCKSYISPSGNYTWINNGTYTDTILNAKGCDSIITINLTVDPADTGVTQNGINLIADAQTAIYQWIDCSNNTPVNGAVSRSFIPTTNGSYAVIVTENGCTDTSACYLINSVSLGEALTSGNIVLYPNPTKGAVTIEVGERQEEVRISLSDVSGQKLKSWSFEQTETVELTIEGASGIYLLHISSGEQEAVFRLVKE